MERNGSSGENCPPEHLKINIYFGDDAAEHLGVMFFADGACF